jgi:hypothetical protein
MQLQRVNRKLNTWDKTQELVHQQKSKIEVRAKQITTKEAKRFALAEKNVSK